MSNEVAIFAGGCFWCMVEPFDSLQGVIEVTSGYTGGDKVDPTDSEGQFNYKGESYRPAIFYTTEEYHQDFYKKEPLHYTIYKKVQVGRTL